MKLFTDQLGNAVQVNWPPKRIISLVPSQTELLFHLGMKDEIAGITKFCIYPHEMFRTKQRVGGTKNLNFNKIAGLHPDLIIGNKEENEEWQIRELMKLYPVWMSDIKCLDDSLDMICCVGELINRNRQAEILSKKISSEFIRLKKTLHLYHHKKLPLHGLSHKGLRVAYFIWRSPYMAAGRDTFISDMLKRCELNNVFDTEYFESRYPKLTPQQIAEAAPQLIILSSEPYPFLEKHIPEFQKLCPDAKIIIVDGEMFSWYGSHLLKAPAYFLSLFSTIL